MKTPYPPKKRRYARGKGTSSGPSYLLVGYMLGSLEGTMAYLHICLGSFVLFYPYFIHHVFAVHCSNSVETLEHLRGFGKAWNEFAE